MSELEKLEPLNRVVDIEGTEVKVLRPKVRQIPKILKSVNPILQDLVEAGKGVDGVDVVLFANIVSKNVDSFIDLVAELVDKDKDFIDDLELDQFIKLTVEVIDENYDFLSKRVLMGINPEARKKMKGIFGA